MAATTLNGGKKRVVLEGGRNNIELEDVERERMIHVGNEGTIYRVRGNVVRRSGGVVTRSREVRLIEKRFHENVGEKVFGNPEAQYGIVRDLIRANREENIGLRIAPTVRLSREEGGKPSIYRTVLDVADFLHPKQRDDFNEDRRKQREAAKKNGFYLGLDSFLPVFDGKTGDVVAVVGDFGTVRRIIGKTEG